MNANCRIVPADGTLIFGIPVLGCLVQKVRHVREYQEAVGEPWWYPELTLILRGQNFAKPLSKCGRTAAQVDGYVEYLAGRNPHQLALGPARLVVQAAQYTSSRARMIVLYELNAVAEKRLHCARIVRLEKEAARVSKYLWFNDQDAIESSGLYG